MTNIELKPHEYPRPTGLSLLQSWLKFGRTPLSFLPQCAAKYGDVVNLSLGVNQVYLLNHPNLVEAVLNQHSYSIKDISYRALKYVVGNGLFLIDGDRWQNHRRLMQSAFCRDRLSIYAEQTVAHTEQILLEWQDKATLKVNREMGLVTVKIVIKTLFGIEVTTKTATEIIQALNIIMLQYAQQAATLYLIPSWLPLGGNWRAAQACRKLQQMVKSLIEQRRLRLEDDLLSSMLRIKDLEDNLWSDRDLEDEVMTVLLAGHDTTANALTWTLMLLGQNIRIQEKLVTEVESVLGKRLPTINDLPHLTYTEMVIKESMRLYPPAWILGRELIQDCQIGGDHYTRGTVIYFSQWVVHRDARWFDKPEQFNPERWADNLEQRLPRHAYFPFGAGARVCIGKAFSMMEMTLMLAMMVQKYRFTLSSNDTPELLPTFILRPRQDLVMAIAERV